MDADKAQEVLEQALELDPRLAAVGMYTGGSFVLDSVRVFCWFKSHEELAFFLREVQPVSYEFDEEDIPGYQEEIQPFLNTLKANGPAESLRTQLNEAVSHTYVIDWWGTFDEMKNGRSELARQLIGYFREDENEVGPIRDEEMDEFLDFLTSCGC